MGDAELRRAVAGVLGREIFVEGPEVGALRVEGELRREARGYAAEIVITTPSGEGLGARTVRQRGHRCDLLLGSLGVVLALMLDGAAESIELPEPPPEPTAPVPSPPLPSAAPPSPPPIASEAPREADTHLLLDAAVGAGLWWGLLPEGSLAIETRTRARLAPTPFSVLLGLSVLPSVGGQLEGSQAGGRFQAMLAHLDLCLSTSPIAALELGGCAGFGGGLARGVGQGVSVSEEASRVLAGLMLEVSALLLPVHPLELGLRAGALIPATRPSFYVSNGPEAIVVHEVEPITGFVALTLGVRTGSENPPSRDLRGE